MPKLTIQESGQQSVFELFDDETTIGRGAANAIQVVDGHASKHHAVIRRLGGRLKLVDLESKNGTRVNGEFRNQRWLAHGDLIAIGAMTMAYDGSDAAAAPVRPVPAYAAAPLVSGPAVAAAPAPAPAAPRVARRAPADDGEERRPRTVARRSNNSAMAMMIGAGVVGLIAIIFLLMMNSGAGKNAMALRRAKEIYTAQGPAAAVAFLNANADPSDVDGYVSVREQLQSWTNMVADQAVYEKEDKAGEVLKQIQRDRIELHLGKKTELDLGRELLQFLEDYKGTQKATELLGSPYGDYPKLRALIEKAKAAPK